MQDQGLFLLRMAEQKKENERNLIATAIEQRLSRLEADTQRLKAATQRLQADTQRLEADTRRLEANTQAVKSESNELGRKQRRQARMMRWHNTVLHGGEPASYDSRNDLACAGAQFHVKLSSCLAYIGSHSCIQGEHMLL